MPNHGGVKVDKLIFLCQGSSLSYKSPANTYILALAFSLYVLPHDVVSFVDIQTAQGTSIWGQSHDSFLVYLQWT
jgi:hypothetical protein